MMSIGPSADSRPDSVGRPDGQGLEEKTDATTSLETLKEWFRESEEALYSSRRASQRDRDYVDGKQWTSAESRALKQRGQSDAVYNRMRGKVDTIVGVEQEMRSDPRAYPRSPNGEDDARTATDALRYVCDRTRFDQTASAVFDQACCVEGVAGVEIIMQPGSNAMLEPEIAINFYPFDRIGWDPHSRRSDWSDSRYQHVITWMDGEQAKREWPDRADMIGQTIASAPTTQSEVYDDAPRFWADRTRNRVQVVQMWWLEHTEWFVATFVGQGFLDDPQPSPYVDDQGESVCGLELCSGYISREGERYGAARQWIGPQDDINKRRSKAQHLLSVRQTVADAGVVKDKRAFKREMARPDGHWDKDADGDLIILPTGDMAQGQLALLQEAKQEIDSTGPNSQSIITGDVAGESGIALQSAQRASMLELSLLLDHHREWKLRCYRAIWSRVRQFWRAPKWLRVTDDPDAMRWIGINQPITAGQQAAEALQARLPPTMAPEQRQVAEQQIQQGLAMDPRAQMVVGIQNQPSLMDVDIVIDEGPDVVTTAAQEFELLVRLSERYPNIPIQAIIKASPLRSKDEILQALEGDPQQAAAMQAAAEKQEQMTEAAIMAQVRRALAAAAKDEAAARQTMAETPSEIEYNEARADQATATAAKTAREAGAMVPFGA